MTIFKYLYYKKTSLYVGLQHIIHLTYRVRLIGYMYKVIRFGLGLAEAAGPKLDCLVVSLYAL
jgi:hypothetical protein